MRFKTYLKEMNYGSLVDKDRYDSLDKADQQLYKYTADGFSGLGHVMDKLIKRYPYEGGTLYRGLHFDDQAQHDKFLKSIEDGVLTAGNFTSWSPSKETAADFAYTKKTYFPDMGIMMAHQKMNDEGEHMSGYGGVVISTEVGKNVGVDVKKTAFAKESEVILPEGEYKVKIVKLTEPYKRRYGDKDAVLALIKEFKQATEHTKELNSKLNYVIKSWLPKLSENEADILMRYSLIKFLKFSKDELAEKFSTFSIDDDYWNSGQQKLKLDIYIPIDDRIYEHCSEKMQAIIRKSVSHIAAGAKKRVEEIMKSSNLDKIQEFDIRGMNALRHFDEAAADRLAEPLRKLLGKRYHELNDRNVTKNMKDYEDIRKHGKKIANIITALQNL